MSGLLDPPRFEFWAFVVSALGLFAYSLYRGGDLLGSAITGLAGGLIISMLLNFGKKKVRDEP